MSHQENYSLRRKLTLLTFSIGLLYFYFGILKFFPNLSPAEQIGCTTVCKLLLGLLPPKLCLFSLATLEVLIGIGLMTGKFLKLTIIIAIAHLVMTFTPLIFFPELIFQGSVISPSLLGQYIYKNIIIICALLVVYPSKKKSLTLEASNQQK